MRSIYISILLATVLPTLTSSVYAQKVYPDQIVLDHLGSNVCRAGYHPLDHYEAGEHVKYLLPFMDDWQIVSLKGLWVVMGPGYKGLIKQQPAGTSPPNTFCYPDENHTEIPKYTDLELPEGDEIDVQYALLHDQDNFVRPLSRLADYLGYAWVGGNHAQYAGEDMNIQHIGDDWVIQGNDIGTCTGYRCDEKTKITVNNFAYRLNDDSFWHGDVTESDKKLVKTITALARNDSDQDQTISVSLKLDESTTWSKTDNFGFSARVTTEDAFNWPLVGTTRLNISIEANKSFSQSKGESTSEQVSLDAQPTVPPHSIIPVRVDLYLSSISYPYQFNADVSYDVNFNGFLRWGGNAWNTHPENRPYRSYTFTVGRGSDKPMNIPYQWEHRYIPNEVKWWDWTWAINEIGLGNIQSALGMSLRPFHSFVSGDFSAESQYAGTMDIGKAQPIDKSSLSLKDNVTTLRAGNVEVISNFDADELNSLGFTNAELSVHAVN